MSLLFWATFLESFTQATPTHPTREKERAKDEPAYNHVLFWHINHLIKLLDRSHISRELLVRVETEWKIQAPSQMRRDERREKRKSKGRKLIYYHYAIF